VKITRIDHPEVELPFEKVADLEALAAAGGEIHWCYHGLVRVLLPGTIQDALQTYQAYKQQRHRRVPMPSHVGKFLWSQTVSMSEAIVAAALARTLAKKADQPLQAGPADEAAGTSEPNH
jgi:phosphotransferase system  glucose/maltose/N-acetylglucosamine-specific IIC component